MSIKGYKVFNPDWTCRGFQYEVGKTYKRNGNIEMCEAGFHFCQKASDCFNYYAFDSNNKVAEVEAIGNVETEDDKSVTDEIIILKELTWYEVLELVNTGKYCTGNRNSGDCNSGNWNSCNFSTGFFNSIEQPLYAFNKPLDVDRYTFNNNIGVIAMNCKYKNNLWIYSKYMTNEEKVAHPEYETTGGYLKTVDFKTACSIMWDNMTDDEKAAVKDIPNFDAKVFEEITGIKVEIYDKE